MLGYLAPSIAMAQKVEIYTFLPFNLQLFLDTKELLCFLGIELARELH
jgi:hypothetical protein